MKFALMKQGATLLELLQIPGSKPRSEAAPQMPALGQIQGFFKSGMVLSDVEGLYKRLQSRGVKFAFELGKPPGGPYRVFGLNDPEGNLLQIFGQ
jgi:hypothetical protein